MITRPIQFNWPHSSAAKQRWTMRVMLKTKIDRCTNYLTRCWPFTLIREWLLRWSRHTPIVRNIFTRMTGVGITFQDLSGSLLTCSATLKDITWVNNLIINRYLMTQRINSSLKFLITKLILIIIISRKL